MCGIEQGNRQECLRLREWVRAEPVRYGSVELP